uniref:Vg1 n=1 Tax=Tetrastichus brontispae TaxID=2033808 RepID=A0A650FKU4_9HYME|nr:Vg1 [Tetrastichus brontispae]
MNMSIELTSHKYLKCVITLRMALVLCVLLAARTVEGIFTPGKEYVYEYEAVSSSGVFVPSKSQSSWGFSGSLIVKAYDDEVLIRFQDLKTKVSNGPEELVMKDDGINVDVPAVADLLKPFAIQYKNGRVDNFSVETNEAVWATNIKRSVAGILQVDLVALDTQSAFHSTEVNHYGECIIEYIVIIESDNKRILRKSVDPRTCKGHSQRAWSIVPHMPCPNADQNPVLKTSERFYEVSIVNNKSQFLSINASGEIYIQPFQSLGEAHFLTATQKMRFISEKDHNEKAKLNEFQTKTVQHDLPEDDDLTQGRATVEKSSIFKSISVLLNRLSQRLENPGLDMEVDNLHNTTISVLLYYLGMLHRGDLQMAYNNISGTSYKEETVRNMFLEALPQVGTTESALFVLELIQSRSVSDITAIQLLTHLPFHVRKPDVQLLLGLQPLLNLHKKIAPEVQHTGILTFGTLVYKTCLVYCPYEMLDDYVKLYLDKLTERKDYEKKMVWLEGLSNIQLGRVVEFLEPIASGNNGEPRHLRALAAWASLPTAPLRPDVIYPVYWPILVNRTEHLEMRIAALTLLIVSNPSPNRLISLYWYLKEEPNPHLYNFYYTTLKSVERTKFPCYARMSGIAAQFARIMKKPPLSQQILTGNYMFDYQDSKRHFGAFVQGIVVANSVTNVPEMAYITLNNHGTGLDLNHVSIYIKGEGILPAISTNFNELPSLAQIEDILKQFKMKHKSGNPVHFELIAKVQQKAVLCLHLNQSNLVDAFKYISTLKESTYHVYETMEFHVNQQRIHVPLTMESVQVTDLGTNVRVAVIATSLFSMRGNFTHFLHGRNNHFILRTSIQGTEMIENYNPLNDFWHAAIRSQSVHGYLPVNVTFGFHETLFFSYNTPEEKLKVGLIAHVRTSTNIRGFKIKSRLKSICPNCTDLYNARRSPEKETKSKTLYNFEVPELEGVFGLKTFDCEDRSLFEESMISDVLSAHQSNCQISPILEVVLLGLHFFDYLSYVPPTGSCGLEAYLEPISSFSSEIKFEYMLRDKHHMFALTRKSITQAEIMRQWNVAVAYDVTSWLSDTLKIKATRSALGERVLKVCIEGDRVTPWDWDFLSTKPSDPAEVKLQIVWGLADTAKGKCNGSSLSIDFTAEITSDQIKESKKNVWPYNECHMQTQGKSFTPFTEACYDASKEMSTLRKYKVSITHENVLIDLLFLSLVSYNRRRY